MADLSALIRSYGGGRPVVSMPDKEATIGTLSAVIGFFEFNRPFFSVTWGLQIATAVGPTSA